MLFLKDNNKLTYFGQKNISFQILTQHIYRGQYNSSFQQIFNIGVSFMGSHTTLNLMCNTCSLFQVLFMDGLMMVW